LAELIAIITSTVAGFVTALSYLILARVLIQLFSSDESKAYEFCFAVTEPVVSPVRNALSKIDALSESPLDFSYIATFMLLSITRLMLPSVAQLL